MSLRDRKEQYYSSHPFVEDHSNRLERVKSLLSQYPKARKLLDIGCGNGSFTSQLKECAADLYGVEISQDLADEAGKRGILVSRLDLDEEDLPFEDDSFDMIFCGEFIEHVVDPDHVLDEIHRTLRPGGTAILTTPNLASYLNRIALLFGFQPYLTGTGLRHNTGKFLGEKNPCPHLIVFTQRALRELLQAHGFRVTNIYGAASPHRMPQPTNVIDNLMSRIPQLASLLIFVMKKP